MAEQQTGLLARVGKNIRKRLLTGVILLLPIGVTLLVLKWLFGWLAGFLQPLALRFVESLPEDAFLSSLPAAYVSFFVSVVSILMLVVLVYLVGLIAYFVVGRKFLKLFDLLLMRIPLVRTVYSSVKQVMESMSLPGQAGFQAVVFVEFPRPGFKAIAFLTGHIEGPDGEELCKVFVPTGPNPTSGFLEFIPKREVIPAAMSVEEAFKMILSGGILSPKRLIAKERQHDEGK